MSEAILAQPAPLAPEAAATARPKVVIVGPTPPPHHGMAEYTRMIVASPVLNRRYSVIHLDTADRRSLANLGRFDVRNALLAFKHAFQLLRIVLSERPAIVYIEVSQNGWAYLRDALLMAVARVGGCRVVTHLHGSRFREFLEQTNGACRWLVRRTSRWVSAAAVLGAELRALYAGLVVDERVHVVAAGIEDAFADGPPTRAQETEVVVSYLGMLYRPKGLLTLLEAAALLRDAGVEARFRVAGDWYSDGDRDEVLALVKRKALSGVVELVGVVDGEAKREFWSATDIFVFPGHQAEGLPLVVLEAMSAGAAVVATRVGLVARVIDDGVSGILVEPQNPAQLADAIRQLVERPDLRERIGSAARSRYEAEFTAARGAERLADLFDTVMAR